MIWRLAISLFFSLLPLTAPGAEAAFEIVSPDIAVASVETSNASTHGLRAIKESINNGEIGVWKPEKSKVLEAVNRLRSDEGLAEVERSALPGIKMRPCFQHLPASKLQVFGITFGGERYLLIDVFEWTAVDERHSPSLWTREAISERTQDGGEAYWWVVFALDAKKFVLCGRR